MADLTGKPIPDGYPNLVTIGATTNDNPTSGTLENGKGNNLTSVTFDGAVVVNESGGNNDFRVEGDSDANLIFADASTDRVGIGTNSPSAALEVYNGTGGQSLFVKFSAISYESLQMGVDATGARIQSLSATKPLYFTVNDQEQLRITSDGYLRMASGSSGIQFGGDTAAANTLDDYEEGTWTPVYEPGTGSFTTMTMDVVSATYTKIGRQVTVIANIRTDNVDATGASGNLQIGGLPFTPGSLGFSAISIGRSIAFVNAPDSGVISNNSSKIFLRKNNTDSSSVVSDLTTGAIADRNNLELTATYFTS
jgi:hypothetical protein